jgi:hypothetical protein
MPLKPIDLQTLFMQMGQVNKERVAEKEGAVIQQAVQGALSTKKNEEKVQSVQQAKEAMGDGIESVKERKSSKKGEGGKREEPKDDSPDEEDPSRIEIIKDPALGGHVDISG